MRSLVFFLVILVSFPLLAKDVYKLTTPDGVVIYSDTYEPGAERFHVSGGESAAKPAAGEAADETGNQAQSTGADGYQAFEIVKPENDETIRSNEGTVPVSLMLSPALADGDAIQIFVDGNKLEGESTSTQFSLRDLNRGSHTLTVKIVNAEGSLLKSTPTVSFHLRKASIIKP